MDLAAEAESRQPIDEVVAEAAAVSQPGELILAKAKVLEVVEGLFEPGGEQEVALRGQGAHEEFEDRGVVHALVEIGLQHGEFVEVGQ